MQKPETMSASISKLQIALEQPHYLQAVWNSQ